MKTEKLELINEILIIQMNHWVLFPVALTVVGVAASYTGQGRPVGLLWGVCGLIPVVYFFLRERVRHLLLFLLLHLAVVALFFILPVQTMVERVLCIACGVGYFIESMVKRFREEETAASPFSPIVAVGFSVVALYIQHYREQVDWDFYYVLTLVGVFALYFIINYIQHYLGFLTVNESSSGYLPAKDMFRSGMGLVGIYTALGAVILLLGTNFDWLAAILNGLKSVVIAILRFLFSLFPQKSAVKEEIPTQDVQPAGGNETLDMLETTEPYLIWQILEVVVIIAFFSGLTFVIIRQLIKLVQYIRERFAAGFGSRKQLVTSEEEIDVREKCGVAKTSAREGQKRSLFGFLTPAERVRRLYKKKILSSAFELTGGGEDSAGALVLLTARECGERLQMSEMAETYEQVRYSGMDVTQETLRRMKEACKG